VQQVLDTFQAGQQERVETEEAKVWEAPNQDFALPQLLTMEHFPEFLHWLVDPYFGYEATGPMRRVRSARTLELIKEDLLCLVRHLPQPPLLLQLCDDVVLTSVLKAISSKVKGPSRLYNIAATALKVLLFFTHTYRLEVPSLPLAQSLVRQYNRLR
jgi:hypothetical protein